MAADNERIQAVFLAASEIEDPAARARYLDGACGGDVGMRTRVESLLRALDQPDSLLDQPVVPPVEVGPTREFAGPEQAATRTYGEEGRDGPADEIPLGFLAPTSRPDSLGRIGHYEVLQVLGQGGFGIVFRAFDDVLQRVVAVKVLAPQLAATSPARKRFLREARTSAAVRHENVVQVYEVGEIPLPYIAMEFIPGETLQQLLDRTGPIEPAEVVRIGRQIAEGLAAAHGQDLIHRDIKPGNVLLEAGAVRVKITDFGLARAADDASISQSGIIAGTPMYMAPEQAKGEKLDQRADLFSLGSVLYQMAAGRAPFRANSTVAVLKRVAEDTPRNIREIIPETPQWLCDIIAKLHAKNPDERFQSAREVADVLADCETQLKAHKELKDFAKIPAHAPAPTRSRFGRERSFKWVKRGAAAALVLLVLGVWFGRSALLYTSNRGELEFMPQEGLVDVIVLQNDEGVIDGNKLHAPVTDWLGMKQSHTLKLPPGRYQVNVGTWPAGVHVGQWEATTSGPFGSNRITIPVINTSAIVTVERGHRLTLRAVMRQEPKPPEPPKSDEGFVQLFNGKDKSGWKMHPEQPGTWEVKDGILIGSTQHSHLFSESADFANFHLRAEVKLNAGGDSGIRFRTPFKMLRGKESWQVIPFGGYEAELTKLHAANAQTGSVWRGRVHLDGPPPNPLFRSVDPSFPRADEWCVYEVIADGNHFITKLDGKVIADCTDPDNTYKSGHIALQCFSPKTYVQFRKVEIKELPSSPSPDGFVRLFNGKDMSGWKRHPDAPGKWSVEGGVLVGRGPEQNYLFSERADYRDFHLRAEAKINPDGNAGVHFHVAMPRIKPNGAPNGYEVQIAGSRGDVNRTGSLFKFPGKDWLVHLVSESPAADDTWFTLEIIVQGRRIITRVNGKTLTDVEDVGPDRGHLALQVFENDVVVQYRKIEIKELPPNSPADPAILQALRDVVIAKERSLSIERKRFEAGVMNRLQLIPTEVDVLEARIALAEAERDQPAVAGHLEALVKLRQEERDLTAMQVEAGVIPVNELNMADVRLAQAKARLAQVKPLPPKVGNDNGKE